jgi:hypothetical protein
MIEQIQGYFIPTACFCLLFLLVSLLLERYKKRISTFLEKHSWLSTKIPRKKIIKILFAWVFILQLKKLFYYEPLLGVIQTKSSVWWVREDILTFHTYILVLFLLGLFLVGVIIGYFAPSRENFGYIFIVYAVFSFFIGLLGVSKLLKELNIEYISNDQIRYTPLLFLKMLCSGRYLGLLTSLAVVFFILDRYKKMKLKINKRNLKYLKAPGIILLVFLIISFYIFPGDWEDRFVQKCQAAKSQKTYEELLEAANSINNHTDKSNALKTFALMMAGRGNIPWAESVARSIPDEDIKKSTLKEMKEILRLK